MRFFTVLVVALCTLYLVSSEANFLLDQKAGECDYNAINGKLLEIKRLVDSINDTTADVLPIIVAAATTLVPTTNCLAKIGGWVVPGTKDATLFTDVCVHTDATADAYKKDPCCNTQLQETQCCRAKNVTVTLAKIASYKPEIDTACGQPAKAKTFINNFFDRYQTRIPQCTSAVATQVKSDYEMLFRMVRCYYRVYAETDDCTSNSDCDGGNGICDITRGKCHSLGQENYKPLVRCIFSNIPETVKRIFRLKLKIKGSDTDEVLHQSFSNYLTQEECYTPLNGNNLVFVKTGAFKTNATCLATKKCNVPGTCVSKCVANCGLNRICDVDVSTFFTSEATCKGYGYCLGSGWVGPNNVPHNATTCAAEKYCTDYAACNEQQTPKCTEQSCLTKGRCLGFPLTKATCITPFKFTASTNQKTCALGEEQKDFGCISTKTGVDCTNSGGQMVAVPTNAQQCHQYKHCVNNNTRTITEMAADTCSKCGGSYESAFKWIAPEWKQSVFFQPQQWRVAAQVPQNRWVRGVDINRLTEVIGGVILLQTIAAYRSLIQCAYVPLIQLTHTIACDCGNPKAPAGTECYQATPTPVATFKVFAGLSEKVKYSDVDVTADKNAVSASSDYVEAEVVKTDAVTVTGTNDLLVVFDTQATPTGYLASDGIAVQKQGGGTLGGTTNICIKRSVQNVPAEYSVAGFATVSNGVILRTGVKITNTDYSLEMCGDVTDSKTYYMAFFKPGTPVSNSSKATFSALAIVFAVVIALFA